MSNNNRTTSEWYRARPTQIDYLTEWACAIKLFATADAHKRMARKRRSRQVFNEAQMIDVACLWGWCYRCATDTGCLGTYNVIGWIDGWMGEFSPLTHCGVFCHCHTGKASETGRQTLYNKIGCTCDKRMTCLSNNSSRTWNWTRCQNIACCCTIEPGQLLTFREFTWLT